MRIFDKNRRITMDSSNELSFFSDELDYYKNNNQYPVQILGKNLTNIYKNINVQVVISRRCNFSCGFCIENDGNVKNPMEIDTSSIFREIISQYLEQGIEPCVSITGGEPTLFVDRLKNILSVCKEFGLKRVNINTNGQNLEKFDEYDGFFVNLSRHHFEDSKNRDIFGKPFNDHIIENRTVMQCVLMKGYIDSIELMKKYMDHYIDIGATGFSFRGLTSLDAEKMYSKEIVFSEKHSIDFYQIMKFVENDPDFEFVQQKIGDHYWFEIWKYKGKFVRFTYSNFDWLRKVESEERKNNQWYSRATIILPTGNVYSGWTYDINKIY